MAANRSGSHRTSTTYPLVLVHGLLGFGTIGPRRNLEYFRGVMRHLENNRDVLRGRAKIYVADIDPLDTIPSRVHQINFVPKVQNRKTSFCVLC